MFEAMEQINEWRQKFGPSYQAVLSAILLQVFY